MKIVRKHVWIGIGIVVALLFAGGAGASLVPVRKPEQASSASIALPSVLPTQKPGILDRVIDHITGGRRLSEEDAARYAHIFAFQDIGEFAKANEEILKLKDHRLMGHVLRQRYLNTAYKTSYPELAEWMRLYTDHPGAQAVYDLALKKKPDAERAPAAPKKPFRGVASQHDFDVSQSLAPATERSGSGKPMAGWTSGLAAWKAGQYEQAAQHFEQVADADRASPWMASAGAYWAARSYLRGHRPEKVSLWLKRAAEYPRTFYGIIALKALGMEQASFNWEVPELTDHHLRLISATPAGKRAVALFDAERPDLAEAELRQINPGNNQDLQEAMLALASKGMPALAMRIGSAFKNKEGQLYDAALYPNAPWEPEKGFEVDKALVYAFIRQESQFDPSAHNKSSGAKGLMQLMPATARHVASADDDLEDATRLKDPLINIDLGQKYLSELLQHSAVDKNLFKLAVAYNAGPGKLARFQRGARASDDPLLFIETFPVAETRIFVERVLTNYWIYRIKFKQTTRSLDDVAEGEWPLYLAQDKSWSRTFAFFSP